MTTPNLKVFMKKLNLKEVTLNESALDKVYNYHIYSGDSMLTTNIVFKIIDNGAHGGVYWTYFYIKDTKSFYFHSFGGQLDKFLLKQLPKPITFHNYKIQHINSRLCDMYYLYFFYLIEQKS